MVYTVHAVKHAADLKKVGDSFGFSLTIWSMLSKFKSLSMFISLEIDCFYGLYSTNIEIFAYSSMTKLSGWLLPVVDAYSNSLTE